MGLSARLAAIIDALPLEPHSRVLEIGCGSGAAARAVAAWLTRGHILAIDRSAAVAQAVAGSEAEIAAGRMSVRQAAVEEFAPGPSELPFDLVFPARVGGLDGRHPTLEKAALARIAAVLAPNGRLFVDCRNRGRVGNGERGSSG